MRGDIGQEIVEVEFIFGGDVFIIFFGGMFLDSFEEGFDLIFVLGLVFFSVFGVDSFQLRQSD